MSKLNAIDTGVVSDDILSPDTFVNGVPHRAFQHLRDQDPVHRHEDDDGILWSLTRYDDVLHANSKPKVFSSAQGIRIEDMDAEELAARRTMMEMDRPQHTTYRRIAQPPFLPRHVNNYEATLRQLARAVIDEVRATTEFDFVQAIARQLPMRMLGKMLGIPDHDGPWLVEIGDALIGNSDPEFTDTPVGLVDTDAYRLMPFRSPHSYALFDYAAQQAADRRETPREDLITRLLEPTRTGDVLSDHDFKNFFTLLVAAGNDTTRYTMAAGMHALILFPEQMQMLKDMPQLMTSAVEEILRWGSATTHFRRTTTQAYPVGDVLIEANQRVLLWFISANYDARQFEHPFRFDVRRTPNPHMSFGLKSPHKCIGEHLARLEIKILLEELLPQLRSIELDGDVRRLRSNFISGIKYLPVKVQWA